MLVCAFIVVITRLGWPKQFRLFWNLPFTRGAKHFESQFNPSGIKDGFYVLLTLNFYLTVTLSCLLILPVSLQVSSFVRIVFMLFLFFLSKNFLALLIGWVFNRQEEIVAIQNTGLAYRSWLALWLLPVLFVVIFTPGLWAVGKSFLTLFLPLAYGFALMFSGLRLWNLLNGINYKILYLCTLEIIPFFYLVYGLKSL